MTETSAEKKARKEVRDALELVALRYEKLERLHAEAREQDHLQRIGGGRAQHLKKAQAAGEVAFAVRLIMRRLKRGGK